MVSLSQVRSWDISSWPPRWRAGLWHSLASTLWTRLFWVRMLPQWLVSSQQFLQHQWWLLLSWERVRFSVSSKASQPLQQSGVLICVCVMPSQRIFTRYDTYLPAVVITVLNAYSWVEDLQVELTNDYRNTLAADSRLWLKVLCWITRFWWLLGPSLVSAVQFYPTSWSGSIQHLLLRCLIYVV